MTLAKRIGLSGLASVAVLIGSGIAHAEDIKGTIVRTFVLSEDTRLVGDVTCQVTGAPCIAFGAPNIALSLNGFTITGPNDASLGCKGANVGTETGIRINGQANGGVGGEGMGQRYEGSAV